MPETTTTRPWKAHGDNPISREQGEAFVTLRLTGGQPYPAQADLNLVAWEPFKAEVRRRLAASDKRQRHQELLGQVRDAEADLAQALQEKQKVYEGLTAPPTGDGPSGGNLAADLAEAQAKSDELGGRAKKIQTGITLLRAHTIKAEGAVRAELQTIVQESARKCIDALAGRRHDTLAVMTANMGPDMDQLCCINAAIAALCSHGFRDSAGEEVFAEESK